MSSAAGEPQQPVAVLSNKLQKQNVTPDDLGREVDFGGEREPKKGCYVCLKKMRGCGLTDELWDAQNVSHVTTVCHELRLTRRLLLLTLSKPLPPKN
jgi:hypothetical protein